MDALTSSLDAWPGLFGANQSMLHYYIGLAVLVAAMIWGAVLAYGSWEEAHEELDPATPEELLDAFKQAHAEGELDEEEFARVRRRIDQSD